MKKVVAHILVFLLVFGNLGVGVSQHRCLGRVVSTAFTLGGQAALNCEMSQDQVITTAPCCENTYTVYSLEDEYKSNVYSENVGQDFSEFISIPYFPAFISIGNDDNLTTLRNIFIPPSAKHSLRVLFQSFIL